jgi:hypothetical protein
LKCGVIEQDFTVKNLLLPNNIERDMLQISSYYIPFLADHIQVNAPIYIFICLMGLGCPGDLDVNVV